MKNLATFFSILIFTSCSYFSIQEKENNTSEIVAIVNTEKLFKSEIESILPKKINKEDSIVFVNSYIQNWAVKKLLLENAKNNISLETSNQISNLVKDYQESLLINNYKEQLIKQRLDTLISDQELEKYYNLNKENFKLNEELVKIKYLIIDPKINNKKELIDLFASDKIENLELLEKQELSFKSHQFNDSVWTPLDNILLKLPFSKEILLKKTKFTQKQDSLGLYLVAIKDVLLRNSIAPKGYLKHTLNQLILHKRKIELIREIEKIILNDATKNNNFKIY